MTTVPGGANNAIEKQDNGHADPILSYEKGAPGLGCSSQDGRRPHPDPSPKGRDIWQELSSGADPRSMHFGAAHEWRADGVNFQPFSASQSQDRYVIQQIDVNGHQWALTGVFDGHLGDATVEHCAYHLPIIVREFLEEILKKHGDRAIPPPLIADLLSRAMTSFDDAIANDVLELFPGGLSSLSKFSDQQIQHVINDQLYGGINYKKARLCMYGTTALVALIDPDHRNLWIANLGDCQGTVITETSPDEWKIDILTTVHNGDNHLEVRRVKREHPGELDCVRDGRVLGAIAPFRCIGDTPFKQPPEFTRRILYNLYPGYHDKSPWEEFLVRNHTPPYISATPEVTHYALDARWAGSGHPHPPRRYLVLCSDGFADLCGSQHDKVLREWARNGGKRGTAAGAKPQNMALRLLWQALGGDDKHVSSVLEQGKHAYCLDDTSIIVQSI
ncbi:hypothetical protein SERLA73DRAFT_94425 [Serpula lacrymans var. lacrymans S7.3]|uniref:PPM-type phosphatase domain-containing protein n=2 Tax=Serpula lacrymans var. lacrymans TaxID=341189 RepID=F8Q6Q9_SERL3|nr:uncharacterized protein SERLADRAFT_441066 [Serpula lacrymans var. lacrymans S7.9]EGN96297.1 hypothetical protein SERLA73DRAFT_94425 [Serpula lacrymans var. lacrymans S7.3]EGO21832.1 hypothetical protein SERLADRAFT_441066 [Serpula lacrymans var. lacrymans S7.9]